MSTRVDELIQLIAREGVISASELVGRLNISRPTLSRAVKTAGDRVVRIGQAKASRYALASHSLGASHLPLYEVNARGGVQQLGVAITLSNGGTYLSEVLPERGYLLGEAGDGLFDGLPYYLDDMRPQGFLGRMIAQDLQSSGLYPQNPQHWSSVDIGRYLVQYGGDQPGNLILGDTALRQFQALDQQTHYVADRSKRYPLLAVEGLKREQPGSSAGGEHPKFTVYTDRGHVIVKYSPKGDGQAARRWRDVLVAEQLAQKVVADAGIQAAQTQVYEFDGRIFLESVRFDRHGEKGRLPMLSLQAIDAEYAGVGEGWMRVAESLAQQKLISSADRQIMAWLSAFGQWIGNSDMHLGNLSFAPDGEQYRLLPVYDMAPMLFAPQRDEVVDRELPIPVRTLDIHEQWYEAGSWASTFWEYVAHELLISDDFRRVAEQQTLAVRRAISR